MSMIEHIETYRIPMEAERLKLLEQQLIQQINELEAQHERLQAQSMNMARQLTEIEHKASNSSQESIPVSNDVRMMQGALAADLQNIQAMRRKIEQQIKFAKIRLDDTRIDLEAIKDVVRDRAPNVSSVSALDGIDPRYASSVLPIVEEYREQQNALSEAAKILDLDLYMNSPSLGRIYASAAGAVQ